MGFEPTTSGTTIRRSNQLSYNHHFKDGKYKVYFKIRIQLKTHFLGKKIAFLAPRKFNMKKPFVLGILYLIGATVLSYALNEVAGFLSNIIWALLLGMLFGNVFNLKKSIGSGLTFGEKKVLTWAIVLMGLQMSITDLTGLAWMIPVLMLMIFLSIWLAEKLAPRFGIRDTCGILIGAGNAICGSSAIAAISPVVKSEPYETGVSISVIHLLGTLGMLIIPALSGIFPLNDEIWGILSGGTLQAVGQAVAGGYAVSETAGETATIIKMTRILFLGPVVILLSYRFSKAQPLETGKKIAFPFFILGFVGMVILSNVINLPETVLSGAKQTERFFLTFAMAAIGSKIYYRDLLLKGFRVLKLGTLIFIVQILLITAVILVKFNFF